jgi:alpha-galactosidase
VIDQDAAGSQGRLVTKSEDQEIWERALFDSGRAIAVFNRGASSAKITINWSKLGLKTAPAHVRDLWAHSDLKVDGTEYSVTVPSHGVVMLRVAQ